MDAVKFLKEAMRMCGSYTNCTNCVLKRKSAAMRCHCFTTSIETEVPDKLVAIIEKWSDEHPTKTRQSVFLERYPDTAKDENEVIDIAPCAIEKSRFGKNSERICNTPEKSCKQCRNEYWNEEVE